jgi:hypothetical protein
MAALMLQRSRSRTMRVPSRPSRISGPDAVHPSRRCRGAALRATDEVRKAWVALEVELLRELGEGDAGERAGSKRVAAEPGCTRAEALTLEPAEAKGRRERGASKPKFTSLALFRHALFHRFRIGRNVIVSLRRCARDDAPDTEFGITLHGTG